MRDDAVTYEIAEDYPMFLRLIEKFPACEREFKNFLRLIAAELPLNQLTLDLGGNNVAIENADLYRADNVREILKIFTDGLTGDALNKLLDGLTRDEPYKNFPQVIDEFRGSDANDR